jgi:hypothetical protein
MKVIAFVVVALSVTLVACKKEECHECHYDKDGQMIEIGELCGEDLKNHEKNGIEVGGVIYEVHCHEH